MAAAGPPPIDAIITGATHLTAAKYFQVASYTFLVYDTIITFGDEVERIWKQPFTFATFLYFLNRYGSPLEYLPVMIAFHDPSWSLSTCLAFVRFEGGGTMAIVAICELILILRIYALYNGSKLILFFLLFVLAAQMSVSGVAMHFTERVPLPPGFIGCILTGKGDIFSAFWIAPLVTDALIFLLTLIQTRRFFKEMSRRAPAFSPPQQIVHILLRDGTMYFLVIFGANLLNVTLYLTLVPDLKAVSATFSQLITSVMVSRLVLNLRTLKVEDEDDAVDDDIFSISDKDVNVKDLDQQQQHHRRRGGHRPYNPHRDRFLGHGWIGNLGQDIDYGETAYSVASPQPHRRRAHHRSNQGSGTGHLNGPDENIAMMDFRGPPRGLSEESYSRPLPTSYAQALQTLSPVRGAPPDAPWPTRPAMTATNTSSPPQSAYHDARSVERNMYGSQPTMSDVTDVSDSTNLTRHPYAAPSTSDYRRW